MHDSTLTLPNGRTIAYTDVGATDAGHPTAVYFHGAPTSRLDRVLFDEELASRGVRVLSADRPGYGGSSPQPGRTMSDHVADVVALADHLGVDRFAVAGLSSGGPYAVAAAALAPSRVSAAAVIAGVHRLPVARAPGTGSSRNEAEVMRQPDADAAVAWCTSSSSAPTAAASSPSPLPEAETASHGRGRRRDGRGVLRHRLAAASPRASRATPATSGCRASRGRSTPAPSSRRCTSSTATPTRSCRWRTRSTRPPLVPGADCTVWPGVTHMGAASKVPDVIASMLGC